MGVTLHFCGTLRSPRDVDGLVEEIVDIAETLGWPHQRIEEELRGVSVHPHENCEALTLLFDHRGSIRNPILESNGYFCKTQFAPVSIHVAIVKLLRHLETRWFAELTVQDEGGYWETGDLEALKRHRDEVERGLDSVEHQLRSANPRHPEESVDDLASRVERILAEFEGKPIPLTPEEHRRVLGPGAPDPDEAARWTIREWVDWFRRYDEEKYPLLGEMRDRPITNDELKQAIVRAEEEQDRFDEASVKFFARAERDLETKEDFASEEGLEPPEPWTESLPAENPEPRDEEIDESHRLGMEFVRQFSDRFAGQEPHPIVRYVLDLALSCLVGVHVAHTWVEMFESQLPSQARRELARERFQTIAALLRSFPELKAEDLSTGAEKLARFFA